MNLLVAAAVAVGVAAAVGGTLGPVLGAVLLALFVATIYLRGYLVPGTPRLTKTYFPDWVLRRFDKAPTGGGPPEDLDLETALTEAGAVTECVGRDDLCLTDAFRAAWRDRIERLRRDDTAREDLAAVLEADPDRLTFEEYGDAFVARFDDRRVGQWESHAAFLSDVAAAHALGRRYDRWGTLDVGTRSALLSGLRLFLDRCPACDGPVAAEQEVVESCCRSLDVVAVTCRACDARLLETEYPK